MSKRGKRCHREPTQPSLSDEESAVFRDAIGPVARLPPPKRRAPERVLPSARPRPREAEQTREVAELRDAPAPVPNIAAGDDLVYRRAGVQASVLRRLRRGYYRCQAEIDLHGMVVDVARQYLALFLQNAHDRDHRCVRVVHGKGLGSGHRGPVLKTKVAGWLAHRDDVLAYVSARPGDGGTGALYVLLKKT